MKLRLGSARACLHKSYSGFEGHDAMTYVSGSPLKRLKEFVANCA
jgi:hypothetical protein